MEGEIKYCEPLGEGEYLSEAQIEVVRNRFDTDKLELTDHMAVISLVDSFVRQNGRATSEYETLFDLVQKSSLMASPSLAYPERVKASAPFLLLLCVYDYLILVGVFKETDIESMRKEALRQMGLGPDVPKA